MPQVYTVYMVAIQTGGLLNWHVTIILLYCITSGDKVIDKINL